ncbi:MAG: hypothetical protein Q8K33_08750 [Cypionkella sp.]|uniref:hypothetical protein n=1 Tax=Cypionkella sp. TaxID=2811411 RepID=UPI002731F420|nr:hypothetical protein [Cypionkella sp.]MDP2048962.1 hypothetical protein [Cypionkella sp.]
MAKDRFKTPHSSPLLPWIVIGVLLVAVVGLLATYVLRPGRSPAEDAQTAAAIAVGAGEVVLAGLTRRTATSLAQVRAA